MLWNSARGDLLVQMAEDGDQFACESLLEGRRGASRTEDAADERQRRITARSARLTAAPSIKFYLEAALMAACETGHVEVARVLLERGAEAGCSDRHRRTPLHLASDWGHAEMVKLLLDQGALAGAIDQEGQTPLHVASENGSVEVARLLLAGGAAVDAVDRHGWTPLKVAAQHGHADVVRLLLSRGAHPRVREL